jgi:hypothetical protein
MTTIETHILDALEAIHTSGMTDEPVMAMMHPLDMDRFKKEIGPLKKDVPTPLRRKDIVYMETDYGPIEIHTSLLMPEGRIYIGPPIDPELKSAIEAIWPQFQAGVDYLKDR